MANKRYDQFPAGAYNTAKIFLQADSATGALEKINLPSADTLLPGQVGNSGKFLQTNGTTTSWATALTSVDTSANYTWTGKHTFNFSVTGAGNSTLFNPTLTASANNQTLTAISVTPTTVPGAFTGLNFYAIDTGLPYRSTGATGVSYFMGDNSAIRGNAASNGTIYIDASRDLTGTIHIRGTTLTLPGFSNASVTTQALTVSGANTVAIITGIQITSFRIGNTTSGQTYYFENNRYGVANSLNISTGAGISHIMTLTPALQVGIGTSSPDSSALLDVSTTTKGLLPPRMTTTQKNAISTPAEGLIVYDTTLHKLCVRTASAWETITSV